MPSPPLARIKQKRPIAMETTLHLQLAINQPNQWMGPIDGINRRNQSTVVWLEEALFLSVHCPNDQTEQGAWMILVVEDGGWI